MIISRTPYRISFFGGGTDYPSWYMKHSGQVLSTTIDKYLYISCRYLPPFFEHRLRLSYSKIEVCQHSSELDHPSVREVMKFLGIDNGLELHYDGDLPDGAGNLTDINANGIVSDIYYNISEYPLYVDQANGNFNLQVGSPNIDAGDPSYSDPDGSVADIGYAYYYQSIPSINFSPEAVNLNRVLVGADTTLTLQVYNPGDSTLTWSVSPDSAWVTVSPVSGSVASGDTTALTVTLSTSALLADTYTPALVFTSNDPDSPTLNYTMTIRIVDSWRVTFSASAGGLTDDNNILGFDEDATDGLDSDWDEPEPPPAPVNYLQVGFLHSAWSDNVTFYTIDIRKNEPNLGMSTIHTPINYWKYF